MQKQGKYTLIAYRPDGVDSVMGCIQGRSSSEYDIISKDDIDSFLEQWAELVFRDMTRGYEDEPYEYNLFYQGNIINQYDGDEDYNKFYASACILAEEKKRQKAEKEAICKAEREARYEKENEEAEKKRLKELLKKYGDLKDE